MDVLIEASALLVALAIFGAALYASRSAAFAPGAWRVLLPIAAGMNAAVRIGFVVVINAIAEPLPWLTALGYAMTLTNALLLVALLSLPARAEATPR